MQIVQMLVSTNEDAKPQDSKLPLDARDDVDEDRYLPRALGCHTRTDTVTINFGLASVEAESVVQSFLPKPVARLRRLNSIRLSKPTRRLSAHLHWIAWKSGRRLARKYSQAVLLAFLCCILAWHFLSTLPFSGRRLLEPEDQLSNEDRRSGAVILHVIGLFYMFIAIAIACDECFVPALEVIIEVLQLSPDVAGATFMAAGGSAPEFFTSLIGTCVGTESDIGTGTIIGSAAFNVLFVIGACAIASPTPLELTWFPLFRDSCFYALDLVVVTIVFLDEQVKWWEALILFCLYLSYTTFMWKNESIQNWALGGAVQDESKVTDKSQAEAEEIAPKQQLECWTISQETVEGNQKTQEVKASIYTGTQSLEDAEEIEESTIHKWSVCINSEAAGTGESGEDDRRSTSKEKQQSNLPRANSMTERSAARRPSHTGRTPFRHTSMRVASHQNQNSVVPLGLKVSSQEFSNSERQDSTGGSHCVEPEEQILEAISRVTSISDPASKESKVSAPKEGCPCAFAPNVSAPRLITDMELTDVVPSQDCSKLGSHCHSSASAPAPPVERSIEGEHDDADDEEEEENEPLSIWPPDSDAGWKDWAWYVATFPIVLCLVCTVPDVRREGLRSLFVLTFIMSICWIAAFTWVMVWFATAISETCGLDEHIMGLTVLAAGTSVPDLLTSMIVAREGHGDMAVSSSIGSNIFDVTVGLPIPWMLYGIMKHGQPVAIKNEALEICVVLLLMMLFFTIATIMCHGWVMTKSMGASLLLLYFCFEVVAVSLTFFPDGSLKLIHV